LQKLKDLWERMRPQVEAKFAAAEAASDVARSAGRRRGRGPLGGGKCARFWRPTPSLAQDLVRLLEGAGVRMTAVYLQGRGAAAIGDRSVAGGEGANVAGRHLTIIHQHGVAPRRCRERRNLAGGLPTPPDREDRAVARVLTQRRSEGRVSTRSCMHVVYALVTRSQHGEQELAWSRKG
jgi:hypothetical protein